MMNLKTLKQLKSIAKIRPLLKVVEKKPSKQVRSPLNVGLRRCVTILPLLRDVFISPKKNVLLSPNYDVNFTFSDICYGKREKTKVLSR